MVLKLRKITSTQYSYRLLTNHGTYYLAKNIANNYFDIKNEQMFIDRFEGKEWTIGESNMSKKDDYNRISNLTDVIVENEDASKPPLTLDDTFDPINKEIEEIFVKNYFTPFENVRGVSDNFTNLNLIVESINLPFGKIEDESILCVLQNFINRGINQKTITNQEISSIFISVFLEIIKYFRDEEIYFSCPEKYKAIYENSINELKSLITMFSLVVEDDMSWILEQLNNIVFIKDDAIFISLEDESLISFRKTDEKFETINFISQTLVKYKRVITPKGVDEKVASSLNDILALGFGNSKSNFKSFKYEQLLALNKIISENESVLAVLKTGFGKSLIYQITSLMQPCVILAVFPITSLIEDQYTIMSSDYGLNYIVQNKDLQKNESSNEELFSRKRVFLVTAERFEKNREQKMFVKFSNFMGMMVFDEAHTISEWGHDFRPAYLISKYMLGNIKSNNQKLVTLALTATAAPHVQKDILKLLNIRTKNLVNIADESGLERKELSFILTKVNDDYDPVESWMSIAHNEISRSKHGTGTSIHYMLYSGSGDWYHRSFNARNVYERCINNDPNIELGIFTGANKAINGVEGKNHSFNQFAGLKNIIATKAFGMGINITDCNNVSLFGAPSSLEDLYQQSGRAGRRGQASTVNIMFSDDNLINPETSERGEMSFFLLIKKERRILQAAFCIELLRLIKQANYDDFSIDVLNFTDFVLEKYAYKKRVKVSQLQTYLKFAVAHLISEFHLIRNYTVEYSGYTIMRFNIYLDEQIKYYKSVMHFIEPVNKKLNLKYEGVLADDINEFYKWYFGELQKQKLIGFNIMAARFKKLNYSSRDNSAEIYEMLTEYYMTKEEDGYIYAKEIYEMITDESTKISKIIISINRILESISMSEFNEITSRYKINREFSYILALILFVYYDVEPIIASVENLWKADYTYNHLKKFQEHIITEQIENKGKHIEKAVLATKDNELMYSYLIWKKLEEM